MVVDYLTGKYLSARGYEVIDLDTFSICNWWMQDELSWVDGLDAHIEEWIWTVHSLALLRSDDDLLVKVFLTSPFEEFRQLQLLITVNRKWRTTRVRQQAKYDGHVLDVLLALIET